MKSTFFTSLFILVAVSIKAQTWTVLTIPTTEDLTTIQFSNDSTGYVFGAAGNVFYTNSGGSSWVNRSAFSQFDILDAQVLSNDTLIAVGEMAVTGSGFWIMSANGGQNWQVMDSLFNDRILGLYFFNSNKGFLAGRKGFLGATAGSTWTPVSIATSDDLEAIAFGNKYNGWIAGEKGLLFKTGNGGSTWNTRNSGVSKDLYHVNAMSPTQIMVAGKDGNVLYSGDGGGFWSHQNTGTQATFHAVDMANNSQGRAVGEAGMIIHTNNQGVVWTTETFPVINQDILDIDLLKDTIGYVCGTMGLVARLGTPQGSSGTLQAGISVDQDACVGELVEFHDNSGGNPNTWVWLFGDGNSAYVPHPTHTYSQVGQYQVKMYVYDANNTQDSAMVTITVHETPVADFDPSVDTLYRWITSTVNFTNNSQGANSYVWDFDNGKTSQQANPATTYDSPGVYKIKLTARNDNCSAEVMKTLVVIGYTGIDAGSTAGIKMYPNPTTTRLFMQLPSDQDHEVMVWNSAGQVIHQDAFLGNQYTIDLSAYPAGMYLVVIRSETGIWQQSIVKQ